MQLNIKKIIITNTIVVTSLLLLSSIFFQANNFKKQYEIAQLTLKELNGIQGTRYNENHLLRLSDLENATTIDEIDRLAKEWKQEKDHWMNNLKQLEIISGGLVGQQPKDIWDLQNQIYSLEGLENAVDESILIELDEKLEEFYRLHPIDQINQHSEIKEYARDYLHMFVQLYLDYKIKEVLDDRLTQVSVGIYEPITGFEYSYNGDQKYRTASAVKVNLIAGILYDAKLDSRDLTELELELIPPIIKESNNQNTTILWRNFNGKQMADILINDLNLQSTEHDETWGATWTTVTDQVKLMRHIAYPNSIFPELEREYILKLMENVVEDQRWGISGGVPSDARVQLKNGWLDTQTSLRWRVNSFGRIEGHGKDYVISIMTTKSPTREYAIETMEEIAKLIWESL